MTTERPASFGPSLFVMFEPPGAPTGEREPRLITDAQEIDWEPRTEVATQSQGPYLPVDEALGDRPDVREALLHCSPDPKLEAWRRYRVLTIGAPVSFAVVILGELAQVRLLDSDAERVTHSPAFREAEADPATRAATLARKDRIERAITMRYANVGFQTALDLLAFVIVLGGLRRLRAVPFAVGLAAGAYWLFHAGAAGRCFGIGAARDWILALLGLSGAFLALLLAPSEAQLLQRLRARLGIAKRAPVASTSTNQRRYGPRQLDALGVLGTVWAGVALPFLLYLLGAHGVPDSWRATFFVGFCFLTFALGLTFRPDRSRQAPRWSALVLAAAIGFGTTICADVASRAALAAVVEARTCAAPNAPNSLRALQEASARETTAARRDTQTHWLAFLVAVGIAPISEELVYRGSLQRISRRLLGPRWAMLVSAVVFGVAHALAFPSAFYQHFALGLAFASTYELAGGGAIATVASAAAHTLWNAWLAGTPTG